MEDSIVVMFKMHERNKTVDIEIPLGISAVELIQGLNKAFVLGIETDDVNQLYMVSERPIALLRGMKTIREYGLRNGSMIHFTR